MIETDRLILRPWRLDDADALFRYASDPLVSEPASWPCHVSVEMSREVIRDVFMPFPHTFAVALKESDEPIGCIGLVPAGCEHYAVAPGEREVGYWIGRPHWRRGYASEALEALIALWRDELHLPSLLITTRRDNVASQRVAAKAGFTPLGSYSHDGVAAEAFRLSLI